MNIAVPLSSSAENALTVQHWSSADPCICMLTDATPSETEIRIGYFDLSILITDSFEPALQLEWAQTQLLL